MNVCKAAALSALVAIAAGTAGAQASADWSVLERARTNTPKPTSAAMTIDDLRTRLFIFADDSMRGRVLADIGNVRATAYLAAELKRIGLEPAGENGSYFQLVPIVERSFDDKSVVKIGDVSLEPWKDYVMRDQGAGQRSIDGVPTIYGGVWGDQSKMITRDQAEGKVVLISTRPNEMGGGAPGLPMRPQVSAYFQKAAAIFVINMPPEQLTAIFRAPSGGMKEESPTSIASYLYLRPELAKAVFNGADLATLAHGTMGKPFTGSPRWMETPVPNPAYNVVGIIRGSDPTLKNEFVAIGAHNDHIGVDSDPQPHDWTYVANHLYRLQGADDADVKLTVADSAKIKAIVDEVRRKTNGASARVDSVYNGADDDGSGSMSVLEMAEYFAGQRVKPKRSMLFIWHVGEEAGLFGSAWYTGHPTVPRESIVAQLNMDMVGRGSASDVTGVTKDGKQIRGGEGYVQLVGSRRLSTELGDLAEKVNVSKGHKMQLDYSLDADAHPQNIYCRSDHYEYAKFGIPVIFFTTGGHADYHQLTDEPQYINYTNLLKVTNFVRDIALETANATMKPKVDKPKPDPKGVCQQ
jgi:hypothetical protein